MVLKLFTETSQLTQR